MRNFVTLVFIIGSGFLLTYCAKSNSEDNDISIIKNHFEIDPTLYYELTKIIDGDTYKIKVDSEEYKIRIIGVDTPESSYNFKTKADAKRTGMDIKEIISLGKEATAFVRKIITEGDSIRIELDVQTYDRYGRILAYVYLTTGEMLNEIILSEGFGQIMTVPPNVKYESGFIEAQKSARENQRGLWGEYY